MSRIDAFISYLRSHLGDMYVWGAQGQCVSDMAAAEAWITGREEDNGASYVKRALAFYRKAMKRPLYAFDCSGLIMHWFQNIQGWAASDTTANGLYNQCTLRSKLDPVKLQPGDLVFIWKGSRMTHVGVYVGNGKTIEAYGRDRGVVELPLGQGDWTHQGRHPYLLAEDDPQSLPELAPAAPTVLSIRSPLMQGDGIAALQEALEGLGYPCGAADGICGRKTMAGIDAFCKAHSDQAAETPDLPDLMHVTVLVCDGQFEGDIGKVV